MNNSVDRASTSGTGKPGFIEWPFSSTLERLTRIKTGKLDANAACDDGRYPFFTCASSPLRIDEAAYDCECVLVAGNGDLNVKYYSGQFNAYQRTYIIESLNSDVLAVPYLYRFLDFYVATLREQSIGGVIKYIKLGNLKDAVIPLPPIPEQNKIVAQLDCIDEGLARANTELLKLDDLVKSRFTEMFGGENDVKAKTLNDVCSIITDGTHQPPSFSSGGVPFLLVSNIVGNRISYETNKFISEEDCVRLMKRTPVEVGDILVSAVGSFGHPAIVKEDKPFCFQRHIAYLKPKRELIDSNYLHAVLLSDDAQRYMDRSAKGVAQRTVTLKSFKEMPIHVPLLEHQREFAVFAQRVDKLRFDVQQQIDKLELLKSSLMQEYFG